MPRIQTHDEHTRIIVDVYHDGSLSDADVDLAVYSAITLAMETIDHHPLLGALIETETE